MRSRVFVRLQPISPEFRGPQVVSLAGVAGSAWAIRGVCCRLNVGNIEKKPRLPASSDIVRDRICSEGGGAKLVDVSDCRGIVDPELDRKAEPWLRASMLQEPNAEALHR